MSEINTNPTGRESQQEALVKILAAMTGSGTSDAAQGAGGEPIPEHDFTSITYYGATNNPHIITYKKGGTTVGTLTLTYVGSGAADDDDVATITRT